MRKRGPISLPSKYLFGLLAIICILFMLLSYAIGFSGGVFRVFSNYLFVPIEKGFNYVAESISVNNNDIKTKEALEKENESLKAEVADLQDKLAKTQIQQSELETLKKLYSLDTSYDTYETTGAHIIASNATNWIDSFTIDKGSKDGIEVDMNVIADGGLVGIVTSVGKKHAIVRTIINDTSSVSSTIVSTSDNCIVSGNLKNIKSNGTIILTNLDDPDCVVNSGDAVVTSNISDKYLPNILIGYVNTLEKDSNKLTTSGTVTPVVDFRHLKEVLIITKQKETGDIGD